MEVTPLKCFKVDALYLHIRPAQGPEGRLLEVEAVERPRSVLDVQGVVEFFDPGHIAGVAEQHRAVPIHGVVHHRPVGPGRVEALGQSVVQRLPLIRAEEQGQEDIAMVVAGQEIEMVIAAVLDEVVLAFGVGVQQERDLAHISAEQDRTQFGPSKLSGEPVLAQFDLQQSFEPHFRLVLPLHQGRAGVVDSEDTAIRQQNAHSPGIADLGRKRPQPFELTGAEIGGLFKVRGFRERRGGEDYRLLPGGNGYARIEHRHQHLGHPVQTQTV